MAFSYPVKILVTLFLLSFVKGDFQALCDWFPNKNTWHIPWVYGFYNTITGWSPDLQANDFKDISYATTCNSITMNNETWGLYVDPRSILGLQSLQFAVGFWVNFESTIGVDIFYFGFIYDVSFRVSSEAEGELTIKAYYGEFTTDPADDLSFTVPMNKWIFLVFQFQGFDPNLDFYPRIVNEMVLVPDHAAYTKTAKGSDFHNPQTMMQFGKGIKVKFYEVLIVWNSEMGDDLLTVYLYGSSGPFAFAIPCTGDCPDAQCTYDGQCVSKRELCDSCSEGSCTSCSDVSLNPDTYCNSCNTGFTLKNGKCNFYLGCADANNCITCSTSSTICDSCPTGYFLYKANSTSISCISCDDSCTDCSPDPNCFNCAELVVQSGDICEVESVGFQISFDTPNIVFDFAYPLSSDLTKNLIKATTIEGTDISTTTWTFTDCTAGSIQCIIGTDLEESDIPIIIDFDFAQA